LTLTRYCDALCLGASNPVPLLVESHRLKPTSILCADWGKEAHKRAVFVADVNDKPIVRRVLRQEWTFAAVMKEAELLASTGPVLVALDVPLGVPSGFLDTVRSSGVGALTSFLDLLLATASWPRFFDASQHPRDWGVHRPFFAVPAGDGGLTSYLDAAKQLDVTSLLRRIDAQTGAKPVFVTAGIPGSVGSSARDVWMALRHLLQQPRSFAVWPFEGSVDALLSARGIVLGETYPRAAYATALTDGPPGSRPRLMVAKTDSRHRHAAIEQLLAQRWVRFNGVQFDGLDDARQNEDDFDACITAAALLRCVLEDLPLAPPLDASIAAEGGILGSGSINLNLREATFKPTAQPSPGFSPPPARPVLRSAVVAPRPGSGAREFTCPIPGCNTVFRGSRGGWDGHVGSLRLHPSWRQELTDPEDRRHQFRIEFPEFFRR